jgi:predicted short-subunit dehydrogenase-like oxidoreductase (DUF2520 family)
MNDLMSLATPRRRRAVATVTVVGAGRLGRPLATALRAAGYEVFGPTARGDDMAQADVVLLCVRDSQVSTAAADARHAARLVGHTSGALTLGETGTDFGLHPLQTFVGDERPDVFAGIGAAIAGTSSPARETARELAESLGAHPFEIADADRRAYHAAASIASNFLLTLEASAESVAATAGLEPAQARALLAPLVRSTVENWAARGPRAALTGPIARGDEATVAGQRAALAARTPQLLPLFDVLAEQTRALARLPSEAPDPHDRPRTAAPKERT